MESVPADRDDVAMEILTNVTAAVAGVVMVVVGVYSLLAILFDDLT